MPNNWAQNVLYCKCYSLIACKTNHYENNRTHIIYMSFYCLCPAKRILCHQDFGIKPV